MQAFTTRWTPAGGWRDVSPRYSRQTQLLLAFGPVEAPTASFFEDVRVRWPNARLVYCSGGFLIDHEDVIDQTVVVMGVGFDAGSVRVELRNGAAAGGCEWIGEELARTLGETAGLKHILVFTDGLHVNGAAFTRGLSRGLLPGVSVSGGLASDGTHFTATGIGVDGPPADKRIAAIGLYGDIVVGTGSSGGWEAFGPERLVTESHGVEVYSLDGERALDVYCRYLGPLASELPGSALLFPISLASPDGGPTVVRTILGVDRDRGSLRFAGDVPQGHRVRLMRATNDRLVDGAALAVQTARGQMQGVTPGAYVCVSCIGRHTVLRSRVEEELYEVGQTAAGAPFAGYYSNGEIAPPNGFPHGAPLLHNQTMTVTAIGEH